MVLVFEAVIGLLLSAVLLLPALNAIIGNSRISNILMGWNGITYGKEQIIKMLYSAFSFRPICRRALYFFRVLM